MLFSDFHVRKSSASGCKELDYKFNQMIPGGLENVLATPEPSCIHSATRRCGSDLYHKEQRATVRFCIFYHKGQILKSLLRNLKRQLKSMHTRDKCINKYINMCLETFMKSVNIFSVIIISDRTISVIRINYYIRYHIKLHSAIKNQKKIS